MTYLKNLSNRIEDKINVYLNNQTLDNLFAIENLIEIYSDVHKDEYGFRPREELGYFRSKYNYTKLAQEVLNNFNKYYSQYIEYLTKQ